MLLGYSSLGATDVDAISISIPLSYIVRAVSAIFSQSIPQLKKTQ